MQWLYAATISYLLSSFSLQGRTEGIRFEHGMTWKEILEKAREEHRYIFVDCFASWCGPCKMMERDVYTKDSVGYFVNANFLAVKLQMDTAKADDEAIRAMYGDAHELREAYKVEAFPMFLFFDPDGKLLHEGLGYKDPAGFVTLCKDAMNPERQYYSLLEEFLAGRVDYRHMPYLALTAVTLKDTLTAIQVARSYINGYLNRAPDSVLYTKDNIQFMRQFTGKTGDEGFQVIYRDPARVDEIMGDSLYAQPFIDYIIAKEFINPVVLAAAKDSLEAPDWGRIESMLTGRFREEDVQQTLAAAKARWYMFKKRWDLYGKFQVESVRLRWPRVGHWELNSVAFDIFNWCSDRESLEAATIWMKEVVNTETDSANLLPASLDTYAGLLYKTGGRVAAIKTEQQALDLAVKYKIPNFTDDFTKTLEKMQKAEPTWQGATR